MSRTVKGILGVLAVMAATLVFVGKLYADVPSGYTPPPPPPPIPELPW